MKQEAKFRTIYQNFRVQNNRHQLEMRFKK